MHIEITYADGSTEKLDVALRGEWVSSGGKWVPGHQVANPERCYFQSDFFCAAVGEGGERAGEVRPDEDEGELFEPFSWKLVGTDEDECRTLLACWLLSLGRTFDPAGDPSTVVGPDAGPDMAERFRLDQQCWMTHLDDPESELAKATEAEGIPGGPKP